MFGQTINWKKAGLTSAALAAIAALVINSCVYLLWKGFMDHGEVCMSSVSWLVYRGFPLYTALDAPARYSIEHGPIVYLVIGGIMKFLGPGFFAAKLSSILAIIATLLLSWYWFKHFIDKRAAFLLVGLEACIMERWYTFCFNRPDSLMVLSALAGMYFVTTVKKRWAAILGAAVFLAILVNLKVDGIFAVIPVLVLIYQKYGRKELIITLAVMAAVGLLPFLLPNISLVHYLQWLGAATAHGLKLKTFLRIMSSLVLYSAGIMAFGLYYGIDLAKIYRQNRYYIGSLVFAAVMLAVIGSKPGSGSNHIAPLVPLIMYLLLIIRSAATGADHLYRLKGWYKYNYGLIVVVCLILVLNAINGQKRVIEYERSYTLSREMIRDLNMTKNKYKGNTMMIGYGEYKTYDRYKQLIPSMVFDNNPYLVDSCAVMDMKFSGLKMPDATKQELEKGEVRIWLLPKGDKPFDLTSNYDQSQIFDEPFRQTFFKHYRLVERTAYFDVWAYNGSSEPVWSYNAAKKEDKTHRL